MWTCQLVAASDRLGLRYDRYYAADTDNFAERFGRFINVSIGLVAYS